ncbi:MAG: hypothetical protein ABSE15_02960 [Candidatus Bathyarchaeia archaeon]
MEKEQETQIPCIKCRSYSAEQRKFSCKPHICKELSVWLQQRCPQLAPNPAETEMRVRIAAIPYVV